MQSNLTSFARACAVTIFLASFAAAQSPVLATDSVTPENGTGGSQVFTFVFSDSKGYQDLLTGNSKVLFAGNAGSSGTNFCWIDIESGGIYLAQDNLGAGWAYLTAGSNTSVQNSQCQINGAGTTISGSGNTLTVNLSITFRAAYAGLKTIYTDVNSSGDDVQVGTYNVTATAPDFTISVAPTSQNVQAGQSTTYTVTATALNGFNQDITLSFGGLTSGNCCADVAGNFTPSVIAGGNGTSTLTVSTSSSTPTSNWQLLVTGTSSSITHTAAAVQLAVTGAAPPPPATISTDSVSPQNGSGGSQVFTFVFSDSKGYQDLFNGNSKVLFAGNNGSSGTNFCWVDITSGGIYLAQDDLSAGWAYLAYGSSASVQNSQCQVNGAGTTVSGSGNTLTVNLSITFRAAYAGMKTIYTDVNSSGGDIQVGTYNVTATAPDFTLTISPSSQSVQAGQSTTYTVTATPENGFSDSIALSAYLLSGTTGSFNPQVLPGGGSSTLTVTASPSAGSSSGSISVTGTSPSITHAATSQLTVNAAGPPPPPTLTTESVSPQNGSGGSQVFTFVFSDSNGYQDLFSGNSKVLFGGNAGSSGNNFCWVDIESGGIYLAQDNLGAGWAYLAYGSNASVQNSQCQINGAGTTISGSGNTLTLNLSITFRAAYAGMKTIYTDVNSTGQGYTSVGTYNVMATAPDFTISVTPSSQNTQAGQSVTYTVTVAPLNGFNQAVTLSLNESSFGNCCAGVSGTFNPIAIPAVGGTSTLTVTTTVSIPASTWQFVVTGASSTDTHVAIPVELTVSGQAPPPPPTISTDSVSPQNASGSAQVFTFTFSDSAGYNDLIGGKYHILINTSPSGSSSCWFLMESTGLYLAPDDPSQTWSFVSYGTSQTAQNSQCGVSGVGTNISGSGNSLTLSLSLTFTAAYAGTKNVYTDVNGSNPAYAAVTTYTVQ